MRHYILILFLLSSNYIIAQNLTKEFLSGELYVKFYESNDLKTFDRNKRIIEQNLIPIPDKMRRKYKIRELENSFSFLTRESTTFKNIFRLKFIDINRTDDLIKELEAIRYCRLCTKNSCL